MAVEPDCLTDFAAKIDPYLGCWRSLSFACIATRVGREWVQVAGRATLSTQPLRSGSISKPIVDLEDFRAYVGCLDPRKIHDLIANLKASTIHSQFGDNTDAVRLVPSGTQGYSWREPQAHQWPAADPGPKDWPSVLSVHGSGPFNLPTYWPNIDTRLRRHDPIYNGLADLCATLGLEYASSGHSPYFNLYAELPARFLAGMVDRKAKGLKLSIEYVGTPELVVQWLPSPKTFPVRVPAGNPQIPAQHEVTIPVPDGVSEAKANLITMECGADEISVGVGWENILLRICEFFDPGQEKLVSFLSKENDLKNANPFELGVARLLGLAGYNVLWFGKGAKDALPDLVAYEREPRGVERIIYAECTLKNPSEKYSDLAKRRDGLCKHLGVEGTNILPVVFVRSETSDQDRRAAIELGLVLCDGDDIRKLRGKIGSDATPEEVFQFLRSLSSLTLIPGGVTSLLK